MLQKKKKGREVSVGTIQCLWCTKETDLPQTKLAIPVTPENIDLPIGFPINGVKPPGGEARNPGINNFNQIVTAGKGPKSRPSIF